MSSLPVGIEALPSFFACKIRSAKAEATKCGLCPGPKWLNERAHITFSPREASKMLMVSAAALLTAYGDAGARGKVSFTGNSSLLTLPYTSALETVRIFLTLAWRQAVRTLSVPSALIRKVFLGFSQEAPTSACPARW